MKKKPLLYAFLDTSIAKKVHNECNAFESDHQDHRRGEQIAADLAQHLPQDATKQTPWGKKKHHHNRDPETNLRDGDATSSKRLGFDEEKAGRVFKAPVAVQQAESVPVTWYAYWA